MLFFFCSLMTQENTMREKQRQLSVVLKKVTMLEKSNSELLARVLQVKYSHPSRSRSLTRMEGVLTDLGAV